MNIPNTLDDAIIEVLLGLSSENIADIKTNKLDSVSMHHVLGRWLRNNWGLWSGSNLRTHFFDMGVHHADDMTDIILSNVVCKIKGEPFNLQVKLDRLRLFWGDQDIDVDAEIKRLRNE